MVPTLIGGFVLAAILGAIANRSHFCTMGAVSDWVNIGDMNRLRSWCLAMSTAILGVGLLEYSNIVDMSLTEANDTASPPYRTPTFVWLRHLVGGLMFGVGMTLGSGCGNKTLVRIGEGNLKSALVLLCMALSASVMLFTSFDHVVFLQWMAPVAVDFSAFGGTGQDIGSTLGIAFRLEEPGTAGLIAALVCGLGLLGWVLNSRDFRGQTDLLVAGLIIGLVVVIGWYITAGATGQNLLDELDFLDERPYAAGAQSFSFVAPTAHTAQYIYQGFAPVYLTFGVVSVLGVVIGSFIYTVTFRKIRIEWFHTRDDFFRHLAGGVLMGVGGVLGMGCTIGQGISGVSTLALGSILTVLAIIGGSAVTMKYQYYRMMREID